MQRQKIDSLLKDNIYAIVSTVNQAGHPESALVGMSHTPSGEIVFATNENTRKIENLKLNSNIALVVGSGVDKMISVQIEGVARIIPALEAADYADIHYKKIPSAKKHQNIAGECFVVVTPIWARYTDFSNNQDEIFEVDFDVS